MSESIQMKFRGQKQTEEVVKDDLMVWILDLDLMESVKNIIATLQTVVMVVSLAKFDFTYFVTF